ncbi:two-component sensor histidine kinase [Bacillus sp. MUM 116]|uniref:sensor histidine kinase n=1 Tax=Bacillus sp. MUM 116 TaxID=1678002 RepID=UPI0008F572C8|nr:HAMP domain-containing sensor histidine kinase [Bacillus sp. MUM 116]OIK12142.1 two-component sensor histidine kinase [Bacillus sp. MUM 116]
MFSLLAAYIGTNILYHDHAQDEMKKILIHNGKKALEIYKTTKSDDLLSFMKAYSGTSGTRLQLYKKDGVPLLKDKNLEVEKKYVDSVLAGNITDNFKGFITHVPIVGIPFQENGKHYAIFVTIERNQFEDQLMTAIHLMYVVIVFFGSLLIIIAARYVVHPLVKLTEATRKMAKGNFNIVLPTNRKDEIGALSASFNVMAKELGKLDQMRQEFVSNVSHEIQSPLTSISGFSKALKQKKISEENRIRYLSIIEQESDRLSRLARNLLRLSHLQQDQLLLNLSNFRLDEQLRGVVIALEPQWSAKEIVTEIHLKPITIEADEDQLKQVWTNLINNSIKFTPHQGKITIKAFLQNNLISVSITDTGIGIPEEERKDIFKPFHKVDKSRDPSIKGNGIGLSIVKQIVDLHHGEINVSEGPEGGAKFIVILPLKYI